MFLSKDKKMFPYQLLLFGSLGLYLWKQSERNKELGSNPVKVRIDTDKLSQAVMPYVPVDPRFQQPVQEGIKKTFDVLFQKVKK